MSQETDFSESKKKLPPPDVKCIKCMNCVEVRFGIQTKEEEISLVVLSFGFVSNVGWIGGIFYINIVSRVEYSAIIIHYHQLHHHQPQQPQTVKVERDSGGQMVVNDLHSSFRVERHRSN